MVVPAAEPVAEPVVAIVVEGGEPVNVVGV